MKTVFFVFTLAFLVAMFVRIVEMSIQFDWVDILWAFVFMMGAAICATGFARHEEDGW
jgi:hypothetical protein